jgi:PAS domain S-box-containing protein
MNPSSFFRNRFPGASSTLFGLLCAGLVIFGIAGFICFRQFESAKTGALNADNTAASLLATVLTEHERAKIGVLLSYAQRPLLIKAVKDRDAAAVHSHMEGMKRNNSEIDLIFLTDRDATIWANYPVYPEAIGQNVSDRDWYRGVSARWEPYTSAVFQLIVGNRPLAVATAVPVMDEQGEVIGILGNSRRLDFMASTVHNTYLNSDTAVTILDQNGNLLFSNKYPFRDKVTDYPLLPVVQQAIKENERLIEAPEPSGGDGKSYLTLYPVEHVGWTVVVERRQEDILRSAYRGFFEIAAIAILLFSVAAFYLFYQRNVVLLRKTEDLLHAEQKLRESEQAELETRVRAEQEIKRLLASIREERDRLDSLISSISDEIWFADKKGNFVLANPIAMQEFGVDATSPAEVEKLISSLELLRPDGTPRPLEESPGSLSLTGKAVRNLEELVRIPASGELRYRQVNSSPVWDADGNITGSVSVVRDITGLKKAENSLREREEQLRLFVEHAPAAIAMFDTQMRYMAVSRRWLADYGLTEQNVLGRSHYEIVPDIPERWKEIHRRCLAGAVELAEEDRFERQDGRVQWLRWEIRPWESASGLVGGIMIFTEDITERRRAEQAVRDGEDRLRFALETSHTGAWDLALADHTAFRSLEHDRIFGYAELLPQWTYEMFLDHVLAEDREEVNAKFRHAVETQGDWGFECRIRRADGEVRWIWAAGRHRADAAGTVRRMAGVVQDITERKRAEEMLRINEESLRHANEFLEQRVRERTMDLQNLAEQLERGRHELRKLASELVMAEERERKRIAGVLHDDIAQTLASVRMRLDLLDHMPSDQKDQSLKETKALLRQSIQETRRLMSDLGNPLLFDMGIKPACEALANRLMEAHPVRIRCDIRDAYKNLDPDVKAILYQVVRELLNNVVKHSRAQNALVTIDMENGHFRVKVADDGVGFDYPMLGAPTAEGGFGLYSIRERLIAMDGSLRVESAPETGTTVTAVLPASLK